MMLTNIDITVFYFINRTCHLNFLDKVMPYLTELGGGMILFLAAIIMIFFGKKQTKVSGLALMAGTTFSYHVVSLLKEAVAKPRPFITLQDVNAVLTESSFSFPSAHASMAFMAAVVLTGAFKKGYIFFPLAAVVAVSRVYLGVHYPSDVIVGGLIGAIIGCILERIAKSVTYEEHPIN